MRGREHHENGQRQAGEHPAPGATTAGASSGMPGGPSAPGSAPHRARPARSPIARAAWSSLGAGFVAVGAIGVVVPGLPTTPFLILAAGCFVRSSQTLYDRLLAHRAFGPLVRDFREGRGIERRVKLAALVTMCIFVAFALGPGLPAERVGVRWLIGAAALIGSAYLLHLPTCSRPKRRD